MARLPKAAHFALTAALLGGAALVPVVLSGSASAQSGSRICGRMWFRSDGGRTETIYKLYEVDKGGLGLIPCLSAQNGGASERDPTNVKSSKLKNVLVFDDWTEAVIEFQTCESVTRSVGQLRFENDGTPWSDTNNTTDLCMNMAKTTEFDGMVAYWLISNPNTGYITSVRHG